MKKLILILGVMASNCFAFETVLAPKYFCKSGDLVGNCFCYQNESPYFPTNKKMGGGCKNGKSFYLKINMITLLHHSEAILNYGTYEFHSNIPLYKGDSKYWVNETGTIWECKTPKGMAWLCDMKKN